MKLGRYHHSSEPEAFSQIKKKTYGSFRSYGSLPKNPELTNSLKLPSIKIKRSSSILSLTSERNTKTNVEKAEKEIFKLKNELSRERINTSVKNAFKLVIPKIHTTNERRVSLPFANEAL